jgi:hypothetical protein
MTTEDSEPGMRAIAGPTWQNEVTGRAVFAEWTNRAITRMDQLRCPILVQIADRDSMRLPPRPVRPRGAKGRVEVRGTRARTSTSTSHGASVRLPTNSTSSAATWPRARLASRPG